MPEGLSEYVAAKKRERQLENIVARVAKEEHMKNALTIAMRRKRQAVAKAKVKELEEKSANEEFERMMRFHMLLVILQDRIDRLAILE